MKSIQWRAIAQNSSGASQHRIVVIYDKQSNGALPALTDIFTANSFVSPMNLNNADRFVVIHDEITESIQSSSLNISSSRFSKCNLETIFTGNTGTITDILSGSLFMTIANNGGTITGVVTALDVYARVRYTDN